MIQDGLLEPLDLALKKKTPTKALKDVNAGKEPTISDSEAEADDDKEFCRNTNKFADLKFNVWARAFKKSEPAIFTKANVKTMQKRGERDTSLKSMQELGEFLMDVNIDDRIDKSLRTKKKIIQHLVSTYIKKGRRGKNVIMPINYNVSSPYSIIKTMPDSIVVKKSGRTARRPSRPHVIHPPYIDLMHSTIRAKLRIEGTDFCKSLHAIFVNDSYIDHQDSQLSKKRLRPPGTLRRRLRAKTFLEIEDKPLLTTSKPAASPKTDSKDDSDDDLLAKHFDSEEQSSKAIISSPAKNKTTKDQKIIADTRISATTLAQGKKKRFDAPVSYSQK